MTDRTALCGLIACLAGELPKRQENWEALLSLANDTLTTSTLAERVLDDGRAGALPDDVRIFLETIRERARWRNQVMDRQLAEALCHLNAAGLVPVAIKGAALRIAERRDEGRLLSDLDLVVQPCDKAKAVRALERAGYACHTMMDDSERPVALARPVDAGMIDLQFGFGGGRLFYDFAELAAASRARSFDGGRVLVPDATTQAALFILHDQIKDQDYWRGLIELRHLLDIALMADDIDWDRLSFKFADPLSRAALRTQLVALERLLGLRIPAHLTAGRWPRIQHQRRLLQLEHPSLSRLLSCITILADALAGRAGWTLSADWHRLPPVRLGMSPQAGGAAHLFRERSVGKV